MTEAQAPVVNVRDPFASAEAPAPDMVEGAVLLDNPVDALPSRVTETSLNKLCSTHGLLRQDCILPNINDRPHLPPAGYTACIKFMCWAGSVPPFNTFLREVLLAFGIAPIQLHPNGHAFIYGAYVLFMQVLSRPPTVNDISFIYRRKHRADSPSYVFIEPNPKCQLICGAWNKFHKYKEEWFFLRCPPGFASRWLAPRE